MVESWRNLMGKRVPIWNETQARAEIVRKAKAGEMLTSSEQLAYSFMLTNEVLKANVEKRPERFGWPGGERRQHIVQPIPGGIERRAVERCEETEPFGWVPPDNSPASMKIAGKVTAELDPWKHRSEGMRCSTCMWSVMKTDPDKPDDMALGKGRCRRHSPTMNGYPVIFHNDWCGDHKLA
jgi:hypothetical protein